MKNVDIKKAKKEARVACKEFDRYFPYSMVGSQTIANLKPPF